MSERTFNSLTEDETNDPGELVSAIVGATISDIDLLPLGGGSARM